MPGKSHSQKGKAGRPVKNGSSPHVSVDYPFLNRPLSEITINAVGAANLCTEIILNAAEEYVREIVMHGEGEKTKELEKFFFGKYYAIYASSFEEYIDPEDLLDGCRIKASKSEIGKSGRLKKKKARSSKPSKKSDS